MMYQVIVQDGGLVVWYGFVLVKWIGDYFQEGVCGWIGGDEGQVLVFVGWVNQCDFGFFVLEDVVINMLKDWFGEFFVICIGFGVGIVMVIWIDGFVVQVDQVEYLDWCRVVQVFEDLEGFVCWVDMVYGLVFVCFVIILWVFC